MTRRQRRVRRRQGGPRKKIVAAAAVVGGVLLTAVLAAGGLVFSIADDAPDVSTLKPIDKGQNSVVYAGDGSRLGLIDSDEVRTPVKLDKIPTSLQEATIAIEDERFYSHNGVDVEGGLRALVKNIESGGISEGASTLTMQLMRNLYITNAKRNYRRKIIEAKMALDYEKDHSKKQILESYLNTAPYGTNQGRTAIGVEAASKVYFSTRAEKLTLPQAALLAGLPQAPTDYNPIQNSRGALQRRNEVLDSMADNDFITQERADSAKNAGLQLNPIKGLFDRQEPFFFDYVESELIKKYGVNTVRRGGLKVYTTIEPAMQDAGLAAISSILSPGGPSGALVAIDPRNGNVKTMVSSASYTDSQFNLAAQGHRQPGSTFKTFALTEAINEGIDPNSTYYDSKPLDFFDPTYGQINVSTYSGTYSGTTSLFAATLASDNSVYMQLALDLGPEKVAEMAKTLGIKTKLDGYPAETLGGLKLGVTPLEMASAYSTLASGGVRHEPTAIKKVVFPNGDEDRPGQGKAKRVLAEPVAYEVWKVLHANITGGTGTGANTGCSGQAGKTGTTDNFTDAWFVGYQPNLATSTWVGYPESNSISMPGVAGGTLPASIWHNFYTNAAVPCESYPVPSEPMVFGDFGGSYTVSKDSSNKYDGNAADAATNAETGKKDKKKNDATTAGGGDQNPGTGTDTPTPQPNPTPAPPAKPPSGGTGGGASPP